jgi:site-specific recombinase XerD
LCKARLFPLIVKIDINAPISSVQAWRILHGAASQVGLDNIGMHSMRKSFAYHAYPQTKDIAVIQLVLNHSSPSVTRRYPGIDDYEVANALGDFEL